MAPLLLTIIPIVKYITLLALIRLLASAIGIESFGISRQYLRLLEFLFELGQRRIERKLGPANQLQFSPTGSANSINEQAEPEVGEPSNTDGGGGPLVVQNGPPFSARTGGMRREKSFSRRKISSAIDGPPIFLLESDEDQDEDQDQDLDLNLEHEQTSGRANLDLQNEIAKPDEVELTHEPEMDGANQAAGQIRRRRHHHHHHYYATKQTSLPDGAPSIGLLASSMADSSKLIEQIEPSEGRRAGPAASEGSLDAAAATNCSNQHEFEAKSRPAMGAVETNTNIGQGKQMDLHTSMILRDLQIDICKFVLKGLEAIVDDDVTKRFTKEELKTWNLLTRTNAGRNYQFMSRSLGFFWLLGLLFRYTCLFPMRCIFTLTGYIWLSLSVTTACWLPNNFLNSGFELRDHCYKLTSMMAFRLLSCGITSRLKFHNRQWRPQKGDICVANHTSPIDVLLLACDNCYSLTGQRHGGLLGFLELLLSRATNHIWFDRNQMKDRQLVMERLRQHAKTKGWPVLIFPEGTCINNSAVMLFRKGSFEIANRITPIAMKYDPRFGDAFWNSSTHSYAQYLLCLMSSWAIKCDVWYLEPMDRLPDECAAEFASRVKAEIAKQAGLKDLNWDGQLKRQATKEIWRDQQREDLVKRLGLDQSLYYDTN